MWNKYKEYLIEHHKDKILEIMKDEDVCKHFSLCIKYINLFDINDFGNELLKNPTKVLQTCDMYLSEVQTDILNQYSSTMEQITSKVIHTRIYELPACPEIHRTIFPKTEDAGCLLQVSGTVVRVTATKMLEYQRSYICLKCKYTFILQGDYEQRYIINTPRKCLNPDKCKGTKIIPLSNNLIPENCRDYQEIKIQEKIGKSGVGSMPSSMWVTLEDDLIDQCKPGDDLTICGIIKRRWMPPVIGKKLDIELVIKANHIQVNNAQHISKIVTKDIQESFVKFWQQHKSRTLIGRDTILRSFCPQIYGLYTIKLAIAIVLSGGSDYKVNDDNSTRVRSEPHILLVGDPGTGKSQLLRFASHVIPRSVLTTGIGSTSAGLTVTAVKEGGEWQLEGGALVLSDGGICCIDEFNSMKEHDRTSIHEAMEQQTISVAKASIVCKLSTRCSILAATNPKGAIDPNEPLSVNVALATPLLSRFDLIFILRDTIDNEWDQQVADYILNDLDVSKDDSETEIWSLEMLQIYFNVIKSIHPTLTNDANAVLRHYYQYQRRAPVRNKSRTTVRLLDSLVRLSQGHARLMYRSSVLVVDAVMAVFLMESSMNSETSLVSKDVDNSHSVFPTNPTEAYRIIATEILTKLQLIDILRKELKNDGIEIMPRETEDNKFECLLNNNSNADSLKLNDDANDQQHIHAVSSNELNASDIFGNKSTTVLDCSANTNDFHTNKEKDDTVTATSTLCNKRKYTKRKMCDTSTPKKISSKKLKHCSENDESELNDFELLNLLPSAVDEFKVDDFGSFVEDCQKNSKKVKKLEKFKYKSGKKLTECMFKDESLASSIPNVSSNTENALEEEHFIRTNKININNLKTTISGSTEELQNVLETSDTLINEHLEPVQNLTVNKTPNRCNAKFNQFKFKPRKDAESSLETVIDVLNSTATTSANLSTDLKLVSNKPIINENVTYLPDIIRADSKETDLRNVQLHKNVSNKKFTFKFDKKITEPITDDQSVVQVNKSTVLINKNSNNEISTVNKNKQFKFHSIEKNHMNVNNLNAITNEGHVTINKSTDNNSQNSQCTVSTLFETDCIDFDNLDLDF